MSLTERVLKVALKTGKSSKHVAALLNHDHRAVASIMAKLRAADRLPALRDGKAAPKLYTEAEDDYLLTARRNRRTWQDIASAMGRSVSSVSERCKLLCLALDYDELPPGMAEAPTPRVAVLAEWPEWARFDGPRSPKLKDAPPPRIVPAHVEAIVGSAAALCTDSIGASTAR